jgi:hypothetical protein
VQILIFKIELDPEIKPIPRNNHLINNLDTTVFRHEANRETSKNESLADDNTTMTIMEYSSLNKVKLNLQDFSVISGLHCNFDKSAVMTTEIPTDDEIRIISELGFKVADQIKLLGVDIKYDLSNVDVIFTGLVTKIVNLASFWERFRLSLPGRITVAKTFLVSQLNYLGCFLKPDDTILARIQDAINNFVKSNLNISSSRIEMPVELGGLGMFNLRQFLDAQMCSWVSRACSLPIDNWRYDLIDLSPNHDVSLLHASDVDQLNNPILYNIATAYEYFYSKFCQCNNNYKAAQIFDNPIIVFGPPINQSICIGTFGRNFYSQYRDQIRRYKEL